MNQTKASKLVKRSDSKDVNTIQPVSQPISLVRAISPPTFIRRKSSNSTPSTAAVEAGKENVENHLAFFSEKVLAARRSGIAGESRLGHQAWIDLYIRNLNERGHHFVVHQHDHPVAGTHYDLRLQCNATSSISFAIMYGLPGNPNSHRLNRNATETRVHNLWNHLIETASLQTGSMLLWDTGEYEVLPWRKDESKGPTTDEDSDDILSDDKSKQSSSSEPQKLHQAFQQRKLRLRLHGTRLPQGYTISLRLTTENFRDEQPRTPKRRRTVNQSNRSSQSKKSYQTTDSESEHIPHPIRRSNSSGITLGRSLSSLQRYESPPVNSSSQIGNANTHDTKSQPSPISHEETNIGNASSDEDDEAVNETIRKSNAYPGATNSINSIHQRRWFLSLDRHASGFVKSPNQHAVATDNSKDLNSSSSHINTSPRKVQWIPRYSPSKIPSSSSSIQTPNSDSDSASDSQVTTPATNNNKKPNPPTGFSPFHVLGRDHERSILTGRLAQDILDDEGVYDFIPRAGWKGVIT